ncbi:MAG: SurA N-terminal domain-containing protein [Muribaculaceae bacterium]|nr:SurA N-terminal domain-containing protein [Muribaculaceae bacterium]
MATLEKIRSKSVLLFVIIIVALLAFILGDFLTSGRTYFGGGTTVAKAGKAKVDYHDYQNRLNLVSEQQRNQANAPDNDDLSQQVIQRLLLEKMMENEYRDLGIVVTDAELSDALTGSAPHPAAQQFIYTMSQSLGLPAPSGQAVYDAMMNPQKYGLPAEAGAQLKQYWAGLESDLEQLMLQEKFDRLVNGLFTANMLDAENLYNDVAITRHIQYAAKPIASVTDEQVEVTDADRRAAWSENKEMYRLNEPVRSIDYIMVRIEPSQADRVAGTKEVEDALMALNAGQGTDMVASNSKFVVNHGTSTRARLTDNRLKSFVDTAKVGEAVILNNSGDKFTIVKLLGVSSAVDSINISMMGRADGGSLDSLLAEVNAGKSFAELIDGDKVQGQDSTWTTLAAPNIPADIKAALENNAVGSAFVLTDTIQGQPASTLYRINRRHTPVSVYEIAQIEYTIDPSQETLTKLSGDLHTFVSNNSSAKDFADNAAAAGYTVLSSAVSASSSHVANAADSRPAVKWLMNAKKGQVMPVYQDNKQTYLLTAAVKNIYDDDYLPYNADLIADQISAQALKDKKAAKLVDEYKGKASDVAGYAKLMGVEPQTGDAMFNSPMLASLGFGESLLQGAIAAAQQGQVTGPLEGNTAVVVFVVTGQDKSGREYKFEEYANQFNRQLGIAGTRPMQDFQRFALLLGNDKIENNSLNFIQGFGE